MRLYGNTRQTHLIKNSIRLSFSNSLEQRDYTPVSRPTSLGVLDRLTRLSDRRPSNFEGVSFSVEDELIDAIMLHLEDIVLPNISIPLPRSDQ